MTAQLRGISHVQFEFETHVHARMDEPAEKVCAVIERYAVSLLSDNPASRAHARDWLPVWTEVQKRQRGLE
jgi:hypothetical protein